MKFEGIDIVKCNYGDDHGIAIEDESCFKLKRSHLIKNIGKHSLIKMTNGSILELEDVKFNGNTTTQTLPIIINAVERGNILIDNCKFINHRISKSVERKEGY